MGPKESPKHHRGWFLDNFGSRLNFEKKSLEICWKIQNFTYFWNFKIWFAASAGRKSADYWPGGPLRSKFFLKIFLLKTDKNWRFYNKKTYPPPKRAVLGGGNKIDVRIIYGWLGLKLFSWPYFFFNDHISVANTNTITILIPLKNY